MRNVLISCFCALFLLVWVHPAYAADHVEVSQQINLSIVAEGNVSFNIDLRIQNNTSEVLREITVPLLAANPGPVRASQNENNIASSMNIGSGEIRLSLNALLPKHSASVNVNYSSARLARESAGAYALYLPAIKQTSKLTSNTKWVVDIANYMPPLIYSSKSELNNYGRHLEWDGNEQIFLVFADPAEGITVNQSLKANKTAVANGEYLINIPYQGENTFVNLNSLPSANAYSTLNGENIFLRLPEDAELSYSVDRFYKDNKVTQDEFRYFKSTVMGFEYDQAQDIIEQAYAKVIEQLQPVSVDQATSLNDVLNIHRAIGVPEARFTSIQYAYLLNQYLQAAEIPSRVMYGYTIGFDSHPQGNLESPISWVEVWQADRIFVFNPYLEDLLKIDGRKLPRSLFLQMGIFDPSIQYDSALGLVGLSQNFVPRPEIVRSNRSELNNPVSIDPQQLNVLVTPPATTPLGWSSYRPTLALTNNSSRILIIDSIKVDDVENIDSLVLAGKLYPAVLPAQQTTLQPVVWVPNVLGGSSQHRLEIEARADYGQEITKVANYTLPVNGNIPIVIVIVTAASLMMIIWIVFIRRHYRLQSL